MKESKEFEKKRRHHKENRNEEYGGKQEEEYREQFHEHVESKHHKHRKGHPIGAILFALFFIIVGVVLGKCVKKCRKNKQRKCRELREKMVNFYFIQKNSNRIAVEIQEQEKILQDLKVEYEKKKAEEQRMVAPTQFLPAVGIMESPNQLRQPRAFGYYQNYPQQVHQQAQQPFYEQIPVGRPINQSNNSSFATEYPQL